MQKEFIPLLFLVLLLMSGLWYYGRTTATVPVVSAYPPASLQANQILVEDTKTSSSVPAGFHSLRDTQLNFTFNAPLDWNAQFLPEGDGQPSLVSPDFSNPLQSMTGAYLNYSSDSLPDPFKGNPAKYMAFLKEQESGTWVGTSLDGHTAFISKSDNGYTMVISQFGDNWFVTIRLADPEKKYSSVLNEFLRSFHAI
jgi:hypothetical protein